MKKSLFLCLAVTFLLFAAGCGDEELSGGGPAAPGESVSESSAVLTAEPPITHEAEPTPLPEVVAGDGGDLDLLASSPYYSGQEALLRDLCHMSTRKPPESFYWLNEEAVRETWGIEGYISACCQDFVTGFDFDRPGKEERQERFFVYIAMFPGVEIPEADGDGAIRYTPVEDWTAVENHPGFETKRLETAFVRASGVSEAEPSSVPLPCVVRVRFQKDGFWIMAQLPETALEAFWENAEELFVPVTAESVEKPVYMKSE